MDMSCLHFGALMKRAAVNIPEQVLCGPQQSTGEFKLYHILASILLLLVSVYYFGFPSGSVVKNPPAMQESREIEPRVQSLGGEDPLEEGMATHSSILAWRILWTEDLLRLQSIELQRVRHDW